MRARDGEFIFEDHGTPWTRWWNLDINLTKVLGYRGEATSHGGMVTIQNYVLMSMAMKDLPRRRRPVHFD